MKAFFVIVLCCIISLGGWSQSFAILDTSDKIFGNLETEMRASIKIKNTGKAPLYLRVRVKEKRIATDEISYHCWTRDCNTPTLESTSTHHKLEIGQTWETFTSVLKSGRSENISKITYTFFNIFDPSDSASVTLQYFVGNRTSNQFLINTSDLNVSNFYPNPATSFVLLDYRLIGNPGKVVIVIQNLLGSVMGEYILNNSESKLKVNTTEFTPGVYFYTLMIDQKSIITKKFIIKR